MEMGDSQQAYCIPGVSIKVEQKIKSENSSGTFVQSGIKYKDIVKTESPKMDTHIPYTIKLQEMMKADKLPETYLQYANGVNVILEGDLKVDNPFTDANVKMEMPIIEGLPKTQMPFTDANVKMEMPIIEGLPKTQMPFTDANVKMEMPIIEGLPKTQMPFTDANVKMEMPIEGLPKKTQMPFTDANIKMEMPAESSHHTHVVDVKCEDGIKTETPFLLSQFMKLEEDCDRVYGSDDQSGDTSGDRCIHPGGSGTHTLEGGQAGYACRTTEPSVGQIMGMVKDETLQTEQHFADVQGVKPPTQTTGISIVDGSDVTLNEDFEIEIDVEETADSQAFSNEIFNNLMNQTSEKYSPKFPSPSQHQSTKREMAISHSSDLTSYTSTQAMERAMPTISNMKSHKSIHTKKELSEETFEPLEQSHTRTKEYQTNKDTVTEQHKCTTCAKEFSSFWALSTHTRTNSGEKSYKCPICEKGFSHRFKLKAHLRKHSGERPYQCQVCGKRFSDRFHLNCHLRTHSGEKPYHCSDCTKSFSMKGDLARHIRFHTGQKPYKCTVCGKSFSQKSDLNRHTRSHTGENPYRCSQCGKAFSQSSHLNRHMRSHTGEKPFTCTACDKSYAHRSHLSRHMSCHTEHNINRQTKPNTHTNKQTHKHKNKQTKTQRNKHM